MLRADPVMDTDQPRLEIGEDEMDDGQKLHGHFGIPTCGNGVVIVTVLAQAGISAGSFRTSPCNRIFVWCAIALARPLTRTLARAALQDAIDHGKAPSQQPTLTPAWTKPPVLPARRVFATDPNSHFRVTYIEMRRFRIRPSSELLEATGWSSPKPFAVIRDLWTPIRANSCNT